MEREELAAWLRLTLTPGVGGGTGRKLLAAFGLPDSVLRQPRAALAQVVTSAQVNALRTEPAELAALFELTWSWLEETGDGAARRRIVVLGDADYPASLLNVEDPPLMLYLLGAGTFVSGKPMHSIAVVGSRNPTPQGAANARQFSKALGLAGLTVVSGLALGIDGAAHEGALDSIMPGSLRLATVAVVGTGLDRVYPKSHLTLAHRIAQHGLLVSEYPLGTPPLVANFPRRNRLIAGLAQGTLVIEAALKSGSLITARLSAEQGKDVFAIPGSIHSPLSRGCHALIRQGAKLVETAQDVLEELGALAQFVAAPATAAPAAPGAPPEPAQQVLLDLIGYDPIDIDTLIVRSGLTAGVLSSMLLHMELRGLIEARPGGRVQRTS